MRSQSSFLLYLFLVTLLGKPEPLQTSHSKLKHGHRLESCLKNVTTVVNANSDHSQMINRRCVELNHRFCLDINLPYRTATLPDYIPGLNFTSVEEVQIYLQRWQGVKRVPRCWPALQVALCSVLMPQCYEDPITSKAIRVSRPSVDICNDLVNENDCKFVERHYGWPAIFNCNDSSLYAKNCINEIQDLRPKPVFEECQYPLVPSNDSALMFNDIKGCAMSCKYPVLSPGDQGDITIFIRLLSATGLIGTSLAIVLFKTNRANSKSSRMAKIIQRSNTCQCIAYIGWLLPIILNYDIACTSSGANLIGLPLKANACLLSFSLTYLPSLANVCWFAYLGKLCHEKIVGKDKKSLDHTKVDRRINLLSCGVPSALFGAVAFLGRIDGRGLYGICTAGQHSTVIKVIFVFMPKIIGTLYGLFYFIRTIFKLMLVRTRKPSLQRNFVRIVALTVLSLTDVIFSVGNHVYEVFHHAKWTEAVDSYIACNLNLKGLRENEFDPEIPGLPECSIESKPIVLIYYIELLSLLAPGIVIASWSCCESNFRGLRRKLIDLLEDENDRQRRAKMYFNLNETAMAATNGQLIGGPNDKEIIHDMIDMTSPSNTDRDIDLGNNSLAGSISLDMSDNSTMNYFPKRIQRYKPNTVRARDIVNDQRNITMQQEELKKRQSDILNIPPDSQIDTLAGQPNILTDPIILAPYLQLLSMMPKLGRPELNQEGEPQFIHGMAQESQ